MNTRTRTLGLSIAAFMTTVMEALAQAPAKVTPKYHRFWLPDAATEVAGRIDTLFNVILWITSIVFVLVFVLMIVFLIRYRSRAGRKATYYHGNTKLEIIWTVIPALIVVALGVASKSVWSQIKQEAPAEDKAFVVEVRPRQFQWDVTYSGGDGKFGTADDLTSINELHVPSGKDVLVRMTAQDVIHSFFVPEFRIKQDAVPGMVTRIWFNVPKAGKFEIACAELCGLGHYRMRGNLTVHTPAEFDAWYQGEIAKKAKELAPPPAASADTSAAPASGSPAGSGAKSDTATASPSGSTAGAATDTASGPSGAPSGKSDTAAGK